MRIAQLNLAPIIKEKLKMSVNQYHFIDNYLFHF